MIRWLFLAASVTAINLHAHAAGPEDIPYALASSLPPDTMEVLQRFPQSGNYALSARINPYYLQGDFNGDHRVDAAVLVKEKSSGKIGIVIAHGGRAPVAVIGAGESIADMGDDFEWMDAWYVYRRRRAEEGASGLAPPKLKADAIMSIKTESASGLIYWNGNRYAWYQQGD